jgi:hypothetical protein
MMSTGINRGLALICKANKLVATATISSNVRIAKMIKKIVGLG